jgi:hypothetical protein
MTRLRSISSTRRSRARSNVEDLQQAVGIDLPQDSIEGLQPDLTEIITSSSSELFRGRRYEPERVLRNLRDVQGDLNQGLLLG